VAETYRQLYRRDPASRPGPLPYGWWRKSVTYHLHHYRTLCRVVVYGANPRKHDEEVFQAALNRAADRTYRRHKSDAASQHDQ
jgi:hypothetical protein